jgi:transposase-like protein
MAGKISRQKGVSGMARRYDKEFRLGAARLVVEQGYTQSEAARRLGVTVTSIKGWIDRFRATGELPAAGQAVPEAEDLKTLRKENKRLQLEVEILKKAAAYFAKESL